MLNWCKGMEASCLKNSVTTLNAHLLLFSYRGQFGVCEPQLAPHKWLKQGYWDISDKQCAVVTLNDYQRLRSQVYKCFLLSKYEHFIYITMCIFILRASEGWVEHGLSISLSHIVFASWFKHLLLLRLPLYHLVLPWQLLGSISTAPR